MKGSPKQNEEDSLSRRKVLASKWRKIMARYPTNTECLEELFTYLNDGEGPRCSKCASYDIVRSRGARTGKCGSCFATVWLTAGTALDGIKAVRAWLGAIKMLEAKVIFNISELAWLAGTAYSSAWALMQKIMFVISNLLASDSEAVDIPLMLFKPLIQKRSKLTPAGLEPFSEQSAKECESFAEALQNTTGSKNRGQAEAESRELLAAADDLTGLSKRLFATLSARPVHIDALHSQLDVPAGMLLSALTVLQLEGLVNENPDSFFSWSARYCLAIHDLDSSTPISLQPADNSAFKATHQGRHTPEGSIVDCVAAAIDAVKLQFGGVSQKYLQLFVATVWCYAAKKKKPKSLLKACFQSKPVRTDDIRSFASGHVVKIMPAI